MKVSGTTNFSSQIEAYTNKLKQLESISLGVDEVMTDDFIQRNTRFDNFDSFMDESGFEYKTQEQFEAIPDELMDEYVSKNSSFKSWSDMFSAAIQIFVNNYLG